MAQLHVVDSPKAAAALRWVVGILEKHKVTYQITGGFAARVHGVDRPLADIDFDIPNAAMSAILGDIKPYLVYGPERYQDDDWDLLLATLEYQGQAIDFSGADDGRCFDKQTKQWVDCVVDFSRAVLTPVDGLTLPIINRTDLIAYKTALAREVDLLDVAALKAGSEHR
jgi:hypothetical protein